MLLYACWRSRLRPARQRRRQDGPLRRGAGCRARGLAGLPAGRASPHVRAARPTGGLPGQRRASAALPGERDRATAGDPGRSRRSGPGGACQGAGEPRRARPHLRRLGLHRTRLRRLHGALAALDVGLVVLALPGDRRLHRRPQPRLLAAEPDRELGRRTDGGRLEPDPDLRRPAGADLELRLLRQAEHRRLDRRLAGDRSGERRGRPGPRRRHRRRQPDLLRHGELLADLERQQRDADLPRRLDRPPARARLRLRRLQQRRLGHRRPRRQVRQHLPRAGRALVRQLERASLGRL